MNKKYVTSLELGRELKELGVRQNAWFWWILDGKGEDGWSLMYDGDVFTLENEKFERVSAFLSDEIEEMLPDFCIYRITKNYFERRVKLLKISDKEFSEDFLAKGNIAEAMGKMFVYLIKEKLINK